MICAPWPAASRMRHSALARFSLGSVRAGHLDQAHAKLGVLHKSIVNGAGRGDGMIAFDPPRSRPLRYRRHAGAPRRTASSRSAGAGSSPRHRARDHHRGHPGPGHARSRYSSPMMMRRAGVPRTRIREAMPEVLRAAERYYLRVCPPLHDKHCPGVAPVLEKLTRRGDPAGAGHRQSDAHRLAQAGAGGPARALPLRRLRRDGENARRPGEARDREARRKGWIDVRAPVSLIGDAPQDIIAAREAGIRSISVQTGITPVEELIAERPDISLPDLRHLRLRMVLGPDPPQ